MSSENLYGGVDGDALLANIDGGDPTYWPKRKQFIANLRDYFSDFDVTPVLWLRRPDTFADSLYRQLLKGAPPTESGTKIRHAETFAQFLVAGAPLWDYDQQVAAIEDVFGDVVVNRLEDGDVVGAMYSQLGVAAPKDAGKRRVNPSADGRVALWLRSVHVGGTRQRGAFGLSPEAAKALREGSDGSMWDSDDMRATFLAGLPNARFGNDFFPAPTPLASVARLTKADAARLSAAFDQWCESHPEAGFHGVPESENPQGLWARESFLVS